MKMGSSNRGQLRPHFGSRSPPFLVAALCVGIGILGISYYSLSNQYTSIESQLVIAVHKYEVIDRESDDLKKQLETKSEDFDRVKVILEKRDSEVIELKKQVSEKESTCDGLSSKLKTLENEVEENRKKLEQGSEMQAAMESLKKQSNQVESDLRKEIEELKKTNSDLQSQIKSQQPVNPSSENKVAEDTLIKDPSYRSKFNADTDIEAGNQPKISNDINQIPHDIPASPSVNKTAAHQESVEANKAVEEVDKVDTNISKEVPDELPSPNKTNEEEISKGVPNDQDDNHIMNEK